MNHFKSLFFQNILPSGVCCLLCMASQTSLFNQSPSCAAVPLIHVITKPSHPIQTALIRVDKAYTAYTFDRYKRTVVFKLFHCCAPCSNFFSNLSKRSKISAFVLVSICTTRWGNGISTPALVNSWKTANIKALWTLKRWLTSLTIHLSSKLSELSPN